MSECAAVEPALVDLALGALSGEERTAVLAHIEVCPRCSAVLAELSTAADDLLHLAPAAEPPVGFEARVFERLGVGASCGQPAGHVSARPRFARRRFPSRERVIVAVCGVAALVVAFVGGLLVSGGGHSPGPSLAASGVETASLRSAGRPVGEVMVYAGDPTWVFMYMDDPAWTGTLRCQVMEEQGPALTLGRFWLSGGKGAWAASVGQPAGRLRSARVVDSAGHVLATARLP